jgi:branched-subunit amino acid aminotransferase/4-amino-4-deoxychorismate lyase
MLWSDGRLYADGELRVNVLDRTFEHGLGLFETFRTWGGTARLLDRHMARLDASARALGLPIGSVRLPDDRAVRSLLAAANLTTEARLRVTLSGGLNVKAGATLWMTCAPLPEAAQHPARVSPKPLLINRTDALFRHKSLNYWQRRLAFDEAARQGHDEVLTTADALTWEGSRTNLFVVRKSTLVTPNLDGPVLPGIMRALVLEVARETALAVVECDGLTRDQLDGADEVFLTNSVRGLIPVGQFGERSWAAPGKWTSTLERLVAERIRAFGG